jgi:hypothetical protein
MARSAGESCWGGSAAACLEAEPFFADVGFFSSGFFSGTAPVMVTSGGT